MSWAASVILAVTTKWRVLVSYTVFIRFLYLSDSHENRAGQVCRAPV
jgi:hypothetical protein